MANKVTHIINCAGKHIQNHWEPIGVAYLTFFWLDQDNQVRNLRKMSTRLTHYCFTFCVGFVGPERPEGWGLECNLWIHWGGSRSHWVRPRALSKRLESCNVRARLLHHAQVQMVPSKESWILEQSQAWPWDQSHLHSLAITVWGSTLEPLQFAYQLQVGRAFKLEPDLCLRGALAA